MPLTARATFNRLLRNGEKLTNSLLNRVVTSFTFVLEGLVGFSDLATTAVRAANTVPDAYWYSTAPLTGGVYEMTIANGPAAYADGLVVCFKAGSANAGAVNLKVNSLASVDLMKQNGAELEAGEIPASYTVCARYNSTLGGFQVMSILSLPDVYRPGTASGTANALTLAVFPLTLTPAELAGRLLIVKAASANTDAATLAINGGAAKNIRKHNNVALVAGDITANATLVLMYDSALDVFLLLNATAERDTAVIASSRNLVITNSAGAPNSQLDIDADEIVLKSSTQSMVASAVNLTVDITTSGANGLDTGVEAASVYYVWVIHNPATATTAGLLSLSSTAPTLPAGYTFKALVGVVNNVTGSNFWTMYQQDRRISVVETQIITSTAPGAGDTYEVLSVGTVVPSIGKRVFGNAGVSTNNPAKLTLAADANGVAAVSIIGAQNVASSNSFMFAAPYELPLKTAQSIYWKSPTGANQRITVSGFTI